MKTKKLLILSFTFLFIYSVVARVFFRDFQNGWEAYVKKDYKTAYELWLPLAEQGDSKAQFFLGFMYDLGFGLQEDDKEAIKWYRLAAEQGDSRAQLFVGFMYDFGQGTPQDDQEAVKWYRLAEEQGYAEAKANLLKLAKANVSEEIKSLLINAENGVAEAQYTLGVMYAKGQGVLQDQKEALKWYGLAAEQGYYAKTNIYNLARKNIPAAKKILISDAENGVTEAQFVFGQMYANGQGAPQNDQEAMKWYGLAAKRGHLRARTNIYGLAVKNVPQALQVLMDDAENGIAEGQVNLAVMRQFGLGVSQDNQEAVKWYRLAAEQEYYQARIDVGPEKVEKITADAEKGIAKAQYTLGVMYTRGLGVPQDQKEAIKWYRLAAKQGYQVKINIYNLARNNIPAAKKILLRDAENGIAEAWFFVAPMYANGQGVPQDYKEAVKWYRLAAEQGTALEKEKVDKLKKKNTPQALKFLTNDGESGVVEAQFNLGVMYARGLGVPQDYKQAVRWYRLAAEQGNAKAQYITGLMHANGQGAPQDYKEAVKWFQLSMQERVVSGKINIYNLARKNILAAKKILTNDAENGITEAQNYLGAMYANGQGVPRDYVLAHMWYNLSSLQGYRNATNQVALVEKKMSPQQIEQAQEMVRDWQPKK